MQVHRLFEIPESQLARFPKRESIVTKENGTWKAYSTQELIDTADRLARGLIALGIGPGDRVALASGNRSEWCLLDQAILRAGAINVPIYPTSSVEDYGYVLQHSESKAFFWSADASF
jgi:long-chain acyl-CoA synthetase